MVFLSVVMTESYFYRTCFVINEFIQILPLFYTLIRRNTNMAVHEILRVLEQRAHKPFVIA